LLFATPATIRETLRLFSPILASHAPEQMLPHGQLFLGLHHSKVVAIQVLVGNMAAVSDSGREEASHSSQDNLYLSIGRPDW
jgi:hypothetical protein